MTGRFVIVALQFADGRPVPNPYFKSFDHEAHGGLGRAVLTADWRESLTFSSFEEAVEFWRKQSKTRPLRPDGKPNRPMTAVTVEVREL